MTTPTRTATGEGESVLEETRNVAAEIEAGLIYQITRLHPDHVEAMSRIEAKLDRLLMRLFGEGE